MSYELNIAASNSAMRSLALPLALHATRPSLDPKLQALLAEGFETVFGCVVLQRYAATARRTDVEACQDETGLEAFANHLHIEDWLDDPPPVGAVRGQAASFVVELVSALHAAHPSDRFSIPISASGADSWVVRFYLQRPGQVWLTPNLDDYRDEAVMLVTAGPDDAATVH